MTDRTSGKLGDDPSGGEREPDAPDVLTVMIVDDDATTLEITGALLEDRGYRVVKRSAALGTAAAILKAQPDVVLLDVQMPGLHGDRIAKAIIPYMHCPPIIFLYSGTCGSDLKGLAKQSGADGFIEKTGDLQQFVQSFERLVRPALLAHGKVPPSSRVR